MAACCKIVVSEPNSCMKKKHLINITHVRHVETESKMATQHLYPGPSRGGDRPGRTKNQRLRRKFQTAFQTGNESLLRVLWQFKD